MTHIKTSVKIDPYPAPVGPEAPYTMLYWPKGEG